jgi:hypothetical protein
MESVIVQYQVPGERHQAILRLGPGQDATFGRGASGRPVQLRIRHSGVPRLAGRITATADHWLLSNLSDDRTYLVENPEGAGEHIKVAPRRLAAPIPFELARVVLPVHREVAEFVVFAPPHRFADLDEVPTLDEDRTAAPFSLDETAKYFLVLVAICEPRLREDSSVALPTDAEIVERLRPLLSCRDLSRSAVNFHIDYLAKIKLRPRESGDGDRRWLEQRRAALVSFALRFDLVRRDHLALLPPPNR